MDGWVQYEQPLGFPGLQQVAQLVKRDLTGARDIAAVIDARVRRRIGSPVPLPAPAWSEQVPAITDPARRAYAVQIAALMDQRKGRIGEHIASIIPPWAAGALGSVPADPTARLEWQRRAASVGAYRELSGYASPTNPVGPSRRPGHRNCARRGTRPRPPSAGLAARTSGA